MITCVAPISTRLRRRPGLRTGDADAAMDDMLERMGGGIARISLPKATEHTAEAAKIVEEMLDICRNRIGGVFMSQVLHPVTHVASSGTPVSIATWPNTCGMTTPGSVSLDERFEIMEAVESRFGYKINIEFIGGRLLQGRAPRQRSEPRSPGASLGTYVCPHHPFGWLAYTLELERIPGIGTCNTRRHRATATSCAGQSGR